MKKVMVAAACAASLTGCQSTAKDSAVPAVLSSSTKAQITAVENALSELMFNRKVNIADTAFSDSNKLTLENDMLKEVQGIVTENLSGSAFSFSMMLQDGSCWLQRNDTKQRVPLPGVTCEPME